MQFHLLFFKFCYPNTVMEKLERVLSALWTVLSKCGMIVKGLTEKFKEKDTRYTGSATLSYEDFMTMIIPFLVA
ncbi:hypothetical protein J5N97_022597 [Dioscorea zingiberensis]|uniref:Uncharacterized protein n=1 Tax=Dioscorea zingiberensis TaxID=325984 RepID=A0A9D5HB19_9LILI|nr:hypothetical protein J5N97_022597 [Dioscorea zingiberensis]